MARFKIEATWRGDVDPGHVAYWFGRSQPSRSPGTDGNVWHELGGTQGPICTAIAAEQFALAWLEENAGMTEDDSVYMHLAAHGTLEKIEALAATGAR